MPELPEVETICRGIRPHIVGRAIDGVAWSGKNLRTVVSIAAMRELLVGNRIDTVTRRAKYILVAMETGNLLVIHLGMTGNLGIFSPELEPSRHCHYRFLLSDGMELRYTDVRRFGSLQVLHADETSAVETTVFSTTGIEPFDSGFTAEYLLATARNRAIPVKSFIMTNQVVAGVGNIYANESLFAAGIDPRRSVSTLTRKSWEKLIASIREVLLRAIECGGSTISDYVNADQESGYFQINFQVYGREGEECRRCGAAILKRQLGGRASYHCPDCQR